MKKVFFLIVICRFFILQAQKNEEYFLRSYLPEKPTIFLPDIEVKRNVFHSLQEGTKIKDTIIISNHFEGELISVSKENDYLYPLFINMEDYYYHLKEFFYTNWLFEETRGYARAKFVMSKEGEIENVFIQGLKKVYDASRVKLVIKRIFENPKIKRKWKPTIDKNGNPMETDIYLIIHFDMDEVFSLHDRPLKYPSY